MAVTLLARVVGVNADTRDAQLAACAGVGVADGVVVDVAVGVVACTAALVAVVVVVVESAPRVRRLFAD